MNKNVYLILSLVLGLVGLIRLYETVDRYSATGSVPWLALVSGVLFLLLAFLQLRRYRNR